MRDRGPGRGQPARQWRRSAAIVLLASLLAACGPQKSASVAPAPAPFNASEVNAHLASDFTDDEVRLILTLSPVVSAFEDPTNEFAHDARAARLGHFLFFDERLSANGEIACATCHDPNRQWGDGRVFAQGLASSTRHTPTLWNVAGQRWFFWDGRADSLWSQALSPLESDREMGIDRVALLHLFAGDAALGRGYAAVFGALPEVARSGRLPSSARPTADRDDPRDAAWRGLRDDDRHAVDRFFTNVGKAIAAFEHLIVSDSSPFDAFVDGLRRRDPAALRAYPEAAQRGLKTFIGIGQCTLCHLGPLFSDREFHNIGLEAFGDLAPDVGRHDGVPIVTGDPFNVLGPFSADPSGAISAKTRYVVQKPNNVGEFKTPTLRNVALTAPYLHDGRFATLTEVVEFYSTLNQRPALGHREETMKQIFLSKRQIADVVAFLETLTGRPPAERLLRRPATPDE